MSRSCLLLIALLGCNDPDPVMPDALVDVDAPPRVCTSLTPQQSYASPVGECCDASAAYLCGSGAGACIADTCVRQCSAHQPRCPIGGMETWTTTQAGNQCLCVD